MTPGKNGRRTIFAAVDISSEPHPGAAWHWRLTASLAALRCCSSDPHWRRAQLVVGRKRVAVIEDGGGGPRGPHRHRLGERAYLLEASWDALVQVDLDGLGVALVCHVHVDRDGLAHMCGVGHSELHDGHVVGVDLHDLRG